MSIATFSRRRGTGALCLWLTTSLAACEQPSLPERPPALVEAQAVQVGDHTRTIRFTGEIRARVQSNLGFRVGGRVVERTVDVGAHVTADQVLARIDPKEQEANISAAEAAVTAAEAGLKQASLTFERQSSLLSQGFTPRQTYDRAEEALRTARGTLDDTAARLSSARDELSQTVLHAGVAGIITARNLEIGQVVQAAEAAFSIAHDGERDAVFDVYETIFLDGPADRRIQLTLVSDPSVKAAGAVREVAPTVDSASGTVRVKFGVDEAPSAMTLGAAVIGERAFKPQKVVTLPASALSSQGGAPAVWIVDPQTKTVALRSVTIERYEAGRIVIREGLQPSEVVVTAGTQLLRPNQTVRLRPNQAVTSLDGSSR